MPPPAGKFLRLTDLDGDSISILKSVVFGVELGIYEQEREIEPPPKKPRKPNPTWLQYALIPVGLVVLFAQLALGDDGSEDPEPRTETVKRECSIVHIRMGSRTRRIRVLETYDEIMAQLGN